MARLLPTLLVLGLLAGTVAAFAVAERLKLEPSPITDTRVPKRVFAPTCECPRDHARIAFRLRRAGSVTVEILDRDERVVRTLVERERFPAGPVVVFWDGRGDQGQLLPQAAYRPRVHLGRQDRTVVLPTPIRIDFVRPRIDVVRLEPRTFSPDRDGRNDVVRLFYRVSEPANAMLFVRGRREIRSKSQRLEDKLDWYGTADGRRLPAGTYTLEVLAEDRAGNTSRPVRQTVRIRYIEALPRVVRTRPRARFGVRVTTDARSYRWRFAGARGIASRARLPLRAPRRPGRFTLYVTVNGHADSVRVVVRRARPR